MSAELETLKLARRLIAKSENWARGYDALDADGRPVNVTDPEATRFCSMGALRCVQENPVTRTNASEMLRKMIGGDKPSVIEFNDSHDHAEVVALFDRAIASAQP